MFAIRFLVLLFLVFFGWSMGQTPPEGLNGFGKLMSGSFFFAAPALYLLPTFEAWRNKQSNLMSIALVNIFLGWSLIGWVVAIVWAFKKPEAVVVERPIELEPVAVTRLQPRAVPEIKTKTCPFCAEDVLAAAIKCKHCGSDLAQPAV
jgi:hypothetical protein